jgi:glycosyltransferase involved in cell wall biosynthesis
MKILHVSYARSWGGGEQQMIDLIHSLNFIKVENILLCRKGSELDEYSQKSGLDYCIIKSTKIKHLKSHFESIQPDVVHIHTGSFIKDFIKLFYYFNIKIPSIYTINGMMRKKYYLSKLKYNFKGIDAYHFVSNAAMIHFKNNVAFPRLNNKLHVIYDGIQSELGVSDIDLRDRLKIKSRDIIVGNVANHTGAKNLILFLKVADEIVNKRGLKNFHFVQIGRFSNLTSDLTDYVDNKEMNSNIHFLDFVPKAELLIQQFSCLIMTSNREGIPLTILEAFKYHTPVVSTIAGGIPEAIISGDNGLLSDLNDHISLANHLLLIYNDKNLREQIVKSAYNIFQHKFLACTMAENTLNLYRKIT